MREKAIADLDQLPDDRFFEEVSNGLQHLAENVTSIESDAHRLTDQRRPRGARILRAVAEEEAAKYLILLDAARCPGGGKRLLAAHLCCFNQHLAKGLYTKCAYLQSATFGELRKYIDQERQQYYLDGPNDIDWIRTRGEIPGPQQARQLHRSAPIGLDPVPGLLGDTCGSHHPTLEALLGQ